MELKKERNYLWDNIKTFLIFLVVAGHLLEGTKLLLPFAKDFDYWIYTFHMPAFIFVSGFLSKSYCKDGKVRAEKVLIFSAYYLVFQLALTGYKMLVGIEVEGAGILDIFHSNRGLWYLLAIIFYYLLIPIAEKLPAYVTITVSVLLSVLISDAPDAGILLAVHRIFVFAPFFFIGYYMSNNALMKIRKINLFIRLLLGSLFVACSILIWSLQNRDDIPIKLFYGKANFTELEVWFRYGALLRLQALAIALLMIAGVLLIIPACRLVTSYIGRHTLSIYLFHMPLVISLMDTEFLEEIQIVSVTDFILLLLAAATIVGVLSIPVFEYPFKWIRLAVQKIQKNPPKHAV